MQLLQGMQLPQAPACALHRHARSRHAGTTLRMCSRSARVGRAHQLRVSAHGPDASATSEKARPGQKKGFIEEMRFVAMKLHTKDQAPKEGQQPAQTPFTKWQPTREGYLRFLCESKVLYEAMEAIMAGGGSPEYAKFQDTGLERVAALEADIEWMTSEYGLPLPETKPDGPGQTYAKLITELAASDPPAFICHYYNVYFAHSAGGRMIGAKLSAELLDRRELEFYKYRDDMKVLLQGVRDSLDELAEGWSREQKDRCLQETEESFKYSGALLRSIATMEH